MTDIESNEFSDHVDKLICEHLRALKQLNRRDLGRVIHAMFINASEEHIDEYFSRLKGIELE